jgi:hypothetical protein
MVDVKKQEDLEKEDVQKQADRTSALSDPTNLVEDGWLLIDLPRLPPLAPAGPLDGVEAKGERKSPKQEHQDGGVLLPHRSLVSVCNVCFFPCSCFLVVLVSLLCLLCVCLVLRPAASCVCFVSFFCDCVVAACVYLCRHRPR